MKLDFIRCNDLFIHNVMGNNASSDVFIPTKYRRSPSKVKGYYRLSKEAQRVLKREDEDHLLRFDDAIPKDVRCIHLLKNVLSMGTNVVWSEREEVGCNSLIWSSIYQKAKLLKENIHKEYGVLVSGQTEYVLWEIYSGSIKQRSHDIKQYDRYAFVLRQCTSPLGNQLVCIHYNALKLCQIRYKQDNTSFYKKINISSLMNASPSKAMQK